MNPTSLESIRSHVRNTQEFTRTLKSSLKTKLGLKIEAQFSFIYMKILTVFICCILLFSCKQEPDKVLRNNQVTLWVNKPQVNIIMRRPDGSTVAFGRWGEELSVMDTNSHYHQLKINYELSNDTIVLALNREHVQVNFRHRVFNELNFLFFRGDSVRITYDTAGLALASVMNRETKPWDLTYDGHIIISQHQYGYSSLQRLLYPFSIGDRAILSRKDSVLLLNRAQSEIDYGNKFLDSVYQVGTLSKPYFEFYSRRNSFRSEILNILQHKNYTRPEWTKDSSNVMHQYYREFMFYFIENTLEKSIPFITTTNSKLRDYRIAFEKVVASSEFTDLEKDIILYQYMEKIIQYHSKSDIERIFERFASVVKNKKLPNLIKQTYNLDFNTSKELYLKSSFEKTITFTDVLKEYKGKLVYVDFWASWCAPCIASLPASEGLRAEYKNKDVAFVFLSKDEDYDAWIRSAGKHNLLLPESFIIQNQYTSNMLEELEIRSIPRYLLYDQKGNLIHKNAPGPEGPEIRNLLNSNLK